VRLSLNFGAAVVVLAPVVDVNLACCWSNHLGSWFSQSKIRYAPAFRSMLVLTGVGLIRIHWTLLWDFLKVVPLSGFYLECALKRKIEKII